SFDELSPDKASVARMGQWGRLKQSAVQCVERIVSGEVTLAAPREEFVVCGLKQINLPCCRQKSRSVVVFLQNSRAIARTSATSRAACDDWPRRVHVHPVNA